MKNQALAHFILTLIILFSIYSLAIVGILYIHFKVVKPLLKLNIKAKSMGEDGQLQMVCRNMRVTTETGDVIQLTASFVHPLT